MRYTYDLYEVHEGVPGIKIREALTLSEVKGSIHELTLDTTWYIIVYDVNVNSGYRITTMKELEEWEDCSERELKINSKHQWNPFDENETEIHLGTPERDIEDKQGHMIDYNLKTKAAIGKLKASDVPPIALLAIGSAMSDGAAKYGRFNWRETGSTASVFYDAMQRHLMDWYAGEDYASDSSVHHLAHLMANCAIVLDSIAVGKLNDDRDKNGPLATNSENWLKRKDADNATQVSEKSSEG